MLRYELKYKTGWCTADIKSLTSRILQNHPATSAIFSLITLRSLFNVIKTIGDNLVRSPLRQNLPAPAGASFLALVPVVTQLSRACSFLDSATSIFGPKSNIIWHLLHAFVAVNIIDVFHKWRLWHGNEARMLFSRSILVSNYQTDIFLCFIFTKIAK